MTPEQRANLTESMLSIGKEIEATAAESVDMGLPFDDIIRMKLDAAWYLRMASEMAEEGGDAKETA